jgi:uncharacterized membrane protein
VIHFAALPSLWLAAIVAAGLGAAAYLTYRRTLMPLSGAQRAVLTLLRAAALLALLLLLWRPVVSMPPQQPDTVVPVLVDTSRSMRVVDADGESRLERSVAALQHTLFPALAPRFRPEVYAVGDGVTPAAIDRLAANGRQTDLQGAIAAIRDRFRGRRLAGIVLLSDGADTGMRSPDSTTGSGPAVFTVGVDGGGELRDREVLGVVAGDPRLDQAAVDLYVSAVSFGYGREPFDLRLRANGDVIETRRVTPAADGSPVDEVFTVSPNPLNPTVYAAEIETASDESIAENNSRTVLVNPAGRKRRILMLEGSPGFEQSFLNRTLSRDPGLELDVVVRKGRNDSGRQTFFVQAASERSPALAQGFPATKEALFQYDGIVVANVEGDFFTQAQLASIAEFAGRRGGGVLVLGGQSFSPKGLIGTPIEELLPVELNDRRTPLSRSATGDVAVRHNVVAVTPEGERHPVMRLGATPEAVRAKWASLPALTATAPLGGPRPGASVLAVTSAPSGLAPVVAVQRYGSGRSMVFAGEASWRWRMLLPATDRSYDHFWRQSVRWLAGPAPDPVAIGVPDAPEPGDSVTIAVDARNAVFEPVADAAVRATLTLPGGSVQELAMKRDAAVGGRFAAGWQPEQPGLYRIQAEATRGQAKLGTADRWVYVGGADREFADPRLNEGVLRRIARDSGGRYVTLDQIGSILSSLEAAVPTQGRTQTRDVWHRVWTMVFIIAVLSAEWILRRRWGLR